MVVIIEVGLVVAAVVEYIFPQLFTNTQSNIIAVNRKV